MTSENEQQITTDDGVSLWVRDVGDPDLPTVLCCHGGPGVGDYLGPVEDALAPEFRVVRWDQRGSGRSDTAGPFTIDRFVADADAVIDALGLDRFVVFGHSWGANLAMHHVQAGARKPVGVVYVSGTGIEWWPDWTLAHKHNQLKRLGDEAGQRMAQLRVAERSAEDDRELRMLYIRSELHDTNDLDTAARIYDAEQTLPSNGEANTSLNDDVKRRSLEQQVIGLSQVRCPVLVLHGGSDPRPVDALASMISTLKKVDVDIIPGAGHSPWIEQPNRLWDRVRDFARLSLAAPA